MPSAVLEYEMFSLTRSTLCEEVTVEYSVEQDGIHDHDDEESDGSSAEEEQWNVISVDGQPTGHPAQKKDAE